MKLGQDIICYNLIFSTFFIYLYLTIFAYIYPLFSLIHPYLVIFAIHCHDLNTCATLTMHMYHSIETTPLCKILEQWIY